jgi:hypothetical protein
MGGFTFDVITKRKETDERFTSADVTEDDDGGLTVAIGDTPLAWYPAGSWTMIRFVSPG